MELEGLPRSAERRCVWRASWVVLALACGGAASEPPTSAGSDAGSRIDAGLGGAGNAAGAAGEAGAGAASDAGPPDREPDAGPPPLITTPVDKVDLLLVVDNSTTMGDEQSVLRTVLPDLVTRLVNPVCVDAQRSYFPAPPPGEDCPSGQAREFSPVADLHIGVITSSLGDVGANAACPSEGFPQYVPDRIDLAHLVGSLPRALGATVGSLGFLDWRPGVDLDELLEGADQMLADVGRAGCELEAPLESMYRFLADPFPYRSLVRVPCPGSSSGALNCVQQEVDAEGRIALDGVLLAQRAAFLRPDSLVAVVLLSDENDCSLQVGAQSWVVVATDDTRPMFRASSACDADPNTQCCYCCPLGPPQGCSADPICNAAIDVLENRLPPDLDGKNLRCFDQKRRFGLDFSYPTARYVNALTERMLCWNALDLSVQGCGADGLIPNPLYALGRPTERVFLEGIVGVPWQAIASGIGVDGRPVSGDQVRFQNAEELAAGNTWAAILGDPGVPWRAATPTLPGTPRVPPTLPQMIESSAPRAGVVAGNAMNGRDYDTRVNGTGPAQDLQYACLSPLPAPRECAGADPSLPCDCAPGSTDRPLCEQTPGDGQAGTLQHWDRAYPGTRQLEVLKGIGPNAVVASICSRNMQDPTRSDYGFRPAIASLIERLSEQLPRDE